MALASDVESRIAQPMTARPQPRAARGNAPNSIDVSPYTATQTGARPGRSCGHGWRALPDFTAGEPFQYCPFFTRPTTPDPAATSAFFPTAAPGSSVVRAPMVAS